MVGRYIITTAIFFTMIIYSNTQFYDNIFARNPLAVQTHSNHRSRANKNTRHIAVPDLSKGLDRVESPSAENKIVRNHQHTTTVKPLKRQNKGTVVSSQRGNEYEISRTNSNNRSPSELDLVDNDDRQSRSEIRDNYYSQPASNSYQDNSNYRVVNSNRPSVAAKPTSYPDISNNAYQSGVVSSDYNYNQNENRRTTRRPDSINYESNNRRTTTPRQYNQFNNFNQYTTVRPGVKPAVVADDNVAFTNKPLTRPATSRPNLDGRPSLGDAILFPEDPNTVPELIVGHDEDYMTETEKRRYIELADRMCDKYKTLDQKQVQAIPLLPSPEPVRVNVSSCKPTTIPLVVGGQVVSISDYPHMALLGWMKILEGGYSWKCGGSLVSDRFVLTAAHCSYIDRDNTVVSGPPQAVQLGSSYLDDPRALVVRISSVIRHPKYKGPKSYFDLALVKLTKPVKFSEVIKPACFGFSSEPTKTIIATGWGRTEFGSDQSRELRSVSLPVWEMADCRKALGTSKKIPEGPSSDSQLCAGDRRGGKDTCQGDSGGPAQVQDGCIWKVVAVTSLGRGCGSADTPGLYALAHKAFIASHVFEGQKIETNTNNYNTDRRNDNNAYEYTNNNNNNNRRVESTNGFTNSNRRQNAGTDNDGSSRRSGSVVDFASTNKRIENNNNRRDTVGIDETAAFDYAGNKKRIQNNSNNRENVGLYNVGNTTPEIVVIDYTGDNKRVVNNNNNRKESEPEIVAIEYTGNNYNDKRFENSNNKRENVGLYNVGNTKPDIVVIDFTGDDKKVVNSNSNRPEIVAVDYTVNNYNDKRIENNNNRRDGVLNDYIDSSKVEIGKNQLPVNTNINLYSSTRNPVGDGRIPANNRPQFSNKRPPIYNPNYSFEVIQVQPDIYDFNSGGKWWNW